MLFEKDEKRQLLRENQDLKRQLQHAKGLITALYKQIDELKQQLAKYQKEKTPSNPQTPKMKVEQHFDSSSDEAEKQTTTFVTESESKNVQASQKVRFKGQNLNLSASIERGGSIQLRKANTKIIFNSQEFVPRKSIQKLLKKSSERRINHNISMDEQNMNKAVSTREISFPAPPLFKQNVSVKSEKMLFKKTSHSRPIFQHFFVTGIGKEGPSLIYHYPHDSNFDFSGYLALLYGENYLRLPDLSPCGSKSKINSSSSQLRQPFQQIYKRQSFVIPILKMKGHSGERDYLIVCEAEEQVHQKHDRESLTYFFTRYYCFLSEWKFFTEFRKLSSLIMDRLQARKRKRDPLSEAEFGAEIAQDVEQSLSFLYQKNTDYNKTIDCCIGQSGLKFSADVPPLQSSFQLVDKYLQSRLFNVQAYVKNGQQSGFQTKMYGLLLTYVLAETKIVLYSSTKSRVSQTVLQLLQLIKPLTYVNPVMVGALREEHQTYLDAPMGLILALWSENRKPNKQKIEIFMNKKLNLAGLIEKAKLTISDGIVINLDTGLVFGGGLSSQLNAIAVKLNNLAIWKKSSKNLREYYKFVQKMLSGRGESEQARGVWAELMFFIKKTQLYCYYLQNRQQ